MPETPTFDCPLWPGCDCPGGTMRPECPGLLTTPTDALTATAFLSQLAARGWLFHPEDSAASALWGKGLPSAVLDRLDSNMRATFRHLPDPCQTALDLEVAA